MLKYQYVFFGDFYRTKTVDGKMQNDHDYYNFQIEASIPIDYKTKKEAENCLCSLRFEIENGHIVLRIYSGWKRNIDKEGWYELVLDKVIATIKWNEWRKYKMSRSKVISQYIDDNYSYVDAIDDFVPDATPWDELFDINNLPEDWHNTVEPNDYYINIIDV